MDEKIFEQVWMEEGGWVLWKLEDARLSAARKKWRRRQGQSRRMEVLRKQLEEGGDGGFGKVGGRRHMCMNKCLLMNLADALQPAPHLLRSLREDANRYRQTKRKEDDNWGWESWNPLLSGGPDYLWHCGMLGAREPQSQQIVVWPRLQQPGPQLNWTTLMVSAGQELLNEELSEHMCSQHSQACLSVYLCLHWQTPGSTTIQANTFARPWRKQIKQKCNGMVPWCGCISGLTLSPSKPACQVSNRRTTCWKKGAKHKSLLQQTAIPTDNQHTYTLQLYLFYCIFLLSSIHQ